MSWIVIKAQGDSIEWFNPLEEEEKREDALLLAMLHAEEHFKRIMPDRGQMIGAMIVGRDEIRGYRFVTNNRTIVSYFIKEKSNAS